MRTILLFGPYTEFHAFNKFNSMIPQFRAGYDRAIAVCPHTAACIMTNADGLICATTGYLARTGSAYPDVLDRMGQQERYDYGFGHSGFMQRALATASALVGDHDTLLYCDDNMFARRDYMPPGARLYFGQEHATLGAWFTTDFKRLADGIRAGFSILPFEQDRDSMARAFPFIDDRTYVYLTRNFRNKQPDYYNSTDFDKNNIEVILGTGHKVLNMGSPCKHFDISHPNYMETSLNLTYSEQLCACSMGRGVFLRGDSGGFSTHACTKLDLFMTTGEWGGSILRPARESRQDLNTFMVQDGPNRKENIVGLVEAHDPKFNRQHVQLGNRMLGLISE